MTLFLSILLRLVLIRGIRDIVDFLVLKLLPAVQELHTLDELVSLVRSVSTLSSPVNPDGYLVVLGVFPKEPSSNTAVDEPEFNENVRIVEAKYMKITARSHSLSSMIFAFSHSNPTIPPTTVLFSSWCPHRIRNLITRSLQPFSLILLMLFHVFMFDCTQHAAPAPSKACSTFKVFAQVVAQSSETLYRFAFTDTRALSAYFGVEVADRALLVPRTHTTRACKDRSTATNYTSFEFIFNPHFSRPSMAMAQADSLVVIHGVMEGGMVSPLLWPRNPCNACIDSALSSNSSIGTLTVCGPMGP